MPEWLPSLIPYADYGGDWNKFIEAVYDCFKRDFLADFNRRTLQFEGVPPGEQDDRWIVYTVTDIADGQVVIDGNHPLAGERLLFSCVVKEVRAATSEELAHGHVHGAHGAHH